MDSSGFLSWLPTPVHFQGSLKSIAGIQDPNQKVKAIQGLALHNLDFVQTQQLDKHLTGLGAFDIKSCGLRPLKLAILASSTVDHLLPSIRIAALRRRIWIDCYVAPYNQYHQEILSAKSGLRDFRPEVVLLAVDAQELIQDISPSLLAEELQARQIRWMQDWATLWDKLKESICGTIIQQILVVPPEPLFGHLDRTTPGAPCHFLRQLNEWLVLQAPEKGLLLLDLEDLASYVGKMNWRNQPLWFHGKLTISPLYAPLYAEHLGRLLAAICGLSYKVLVVDLDNTLWGGVIGDDGLDGIELGQGNGAGEAYLAFQEYLKRLKDRGVVLAVSSKNEEANALLPFTHHPEMRLKREDFSVFKADWDNKAAHLEFISSKLNLGLDALVFFDDNPAERGLIRQMLPMVAVPEVPDDPAEYVNCLSQAGYFEAISFTSEDTTRAEQYKSNILRDELQSRSHDIQDYLRQLEMRMTIAPFDAVGASRIAQLINKSNQFNLTTRRYTLAQVLDMQQDPHVLTFQVRLSDRYGDNGMICVVIAKPVDAKVLAIDSWLMSCRVLGRQVEEEVLNQLVIRARERRFQFLRGEYFPTAKNPLVRDHYSKLGFLRVQPNGSPASEPTTWDLDLERFNFYNTHIAVNPAETLAP